MVVIGNFRSGAELREKKRQPMCYVARLLVDEKGTLRPCLVSDISDSGARLVLQSDGDLPERFVLLLTKTGKARRHCRLVWRDGLNLGVEFPERIPDI